MTYQPAAGARDLLPVDVAQKHWIEDRLQQVFQRWGYHRIITSTLERMDTLMAGGAIERSAVLQLQNFEDEELGLRPELTASIARTAVTRMAGTTYPQRLYYNANVFQRTREFRQNYQHELYQAGVELLGSSGVLTDAEVLLLVADCLQALSLEGWCLILGDAGITRALLKAFPEDLRQTVTSAIAGLDRITIDSLPLGDELIELARIILDLRGKPTDVFEKLSSLGLEQPLEEVMKLKSLVELIESRGDFPLILDLSLIQTINYYSGIVFEVVSNSNDGQARVLGRGGRYDELLGLYHPQKENIPGIGFSLFIEDLYQVLLLKGQLPQTTPASDWLIVPETPQANAAAFAYAAKLRQSNNLVRVEMDLGGRNTNEIRQYASDRHIAQIAWLKSDGSSIIESLNGKTEPATGKSS